jgi:hypothetical protein
MSRYLFYYCTKKKSRHLAGSYIAKIWIIPVQEQQYFLFLPAVIFP